MTGPEGLVRLAMESYVDGCLGEGAAAVVAAEEADVAESPALQRAQRIIATDEARHAELAWAILEWAASVGPETVRATLSGVTATLDDPVAQPNDENAGSTERFGILGAARSARARVSHARRTRSRLRARLGL